MRVTKFGHSCLLVEVQKARILIDPGNFSTGQETVSGLHAVLITHEHPDHITLDSVKTILSNNPNALIYTNEGVGKLLSEAGISYQTLENGTVAEIEGVSVRGYGVDHACIHDSIPLIRNTGYMIADAFFYPGDALTQFPQNVEVLALPVAAPWLTLADAVEYALKVKPKVCFPVHDGMLRPERVGSTRFIPKNILEKAGIGFVDMVEGSVTEF
jgi:L-ascorbate metabolism protein UlaG (beta-lactamase superfamily)